MGLFDFLRTKSPQEQGLAFLMANSQIVLSARSPKEMLGILIQHPEWKRLPLDVLLELCTRAADRARKWVVYDCEHAFEILTFAAQKSGVITHNFLRLCSEDPVFTGASDQLTLFAFTFYRRASELVQAAILKMGGRPSPAADGSSLQGSLSDGLPRQAAFLHMLGQMEMTPARLAQLDHYYEVCLGSPPQARIGEMLEDAKVYAEASLVCDRYHVLSFVPAALAWVLKEGDFGKALRICDEGIRWAAEMRTSLVHSVSIADIHAMEDPARGRLLKETREQLLDAVKLAGGVPR